MRGTAILIGAPYCITPLGRGVDANVRAMRDGRTGALRDEKEGVHVCRIPKNVFDKSGPRATELSVTCVEGTRELLQRDVISDPRTAVILSTTKGDIGFLEEGDASAARIPQLAAQIRERIGYARTPIIMSNACASGTSAMILGAGLIESGEADHVLLIGVDILSHFVISGFASLYALASGPCRPYDAERDGIVLGEAAVSMVMSKDPTLFAEPTGHYLGGSIANDANHISGPSRTGEGLVRAVNGALRSAALTTNDIHTINAHGTATEYNDAMEAIAFGRCAMWNIPLNSFKGSFGHTLGAAGLLESVLALHALQQGTLLSTEGTRTVGLPEPLNVLLEHTMTVGDTLLKTSSGFGGSNAAVILRAWTN